MDVVPGEAADAADIQVGDRLLAVDGVPLDRLEGLYRGKVPGDVVTYVLERGGDRVDASVVLAEQPLSMLLHQAIQLSVGLAFCLIGIVAWRLRRSDRVVRLAFLFSQFGAISLSTQFLSSLRWPGLLLAAEGSLALVVPLAVHLYSIFPEEIRGRGARILIGSAYAAGGLLLAWTVVEHTTKGSLHISGLLVASRRAYGGIALVGALGLLIYPPTASYVRSRLFRKVRADQGSGWSRPMRSRRILIAGMVGSLLPMLVLSYLPAWLFGAPLLNFTLATLFFLLWPLSFGYALYTGYLGRVDPWVSRSLVLILANVALLTALAATWAILDRTILDPTGNQLLRLGSVAVILGVYSRALVGARRFVDWLLGSLPSYQGAVTQSSAELSEAHNVESLASRLIRIGEQLHFEAGLLLWRSGDHLVVRRYYGYEDQAARGWWIPGDGELAQHLVLCDG
ncbi:MAG: PDZ domain-containing protein [Chloroflexota bacterium]|nr:PDZ domain-containing protein [Chloroflexota bacterium]